VNQISRQNLDNEINDQRQKYPKTYSKTKLRENNNSDSNKSNSSLSNRHNSINDNNKISNKKDFDYNNNTDKSRYYNLINERKRNKKDYSKLYPNKNQRNNDYLSDNNSRRIKSRNTNKKAKKKQQLVTKTHKKHRHLKHSKNKKSHNFIPNSVLPLKQRRSKKKVKAIYKAKKGLVNKKKYISPQKNIFSKNLIKKMAKNQIRYNKAKTPSHADITKWEIIINMKNKKIRLLKDRIQYLIKINKSLLDKVDCSSKNKLKRNKISLIEKKDNKKIYSKIKKLSKKMRSNQKILKVLKKSRSK